MDREAFLKLLVAQLSHQDPLQPMEGTEFVTQLAQFTAVEQQLIQSAKLDLISLQMSGLANNEAAGLVGQFVTVRGKGVAFDGVSPTTAAVTLSSPAQKVKVEVRGPDGELVRTLELGPQGKGPLSIPWDGKTDAGGTAPPGTYTFEVKAEDTKGEPVNVTQDVSGTVVQVSFDKGFPELILDSGVRAPISDLVSVGTSGGAGGAGAAAPSLNLAQLSQISALLGSMQP